MKIGSVAWGWTPTPEDMPTPGSLEKIADQVRSLGYDFIDYLSDYQSLDGYFTPAACRKLRDHAELLGMYIGGFVFQSNLWNDPDPAVTKRQLDYFEKCCDAANALGAGIVSCIIPGPYGARPSRRPSPSDKLATNLPADYDWSADWHRFVTSLSRAAEIAKSHSLRVAMECFPRSLCSTPHAMLQLLADVNTGNLGIQLDTAHLTNQRIDVETAIYMLGPDRLFHIHAKDTDAVTRDNLAPGTGIVDYRAVFQALKNVGYTGNVSVEVEFSTNPALYMKQGLAHVKECLGMVDAMPHWGNL